MDGRTFVARFGNVISLPASQPDKRRARSPWAAKGDIEYALGASDTYKINYHLDLAVTLTGDKATRPRSGRSSEAGDVVIDTQSFTVTTQGYASYGVYGINLGKNSDIDIDLRDGTTITTGGRSASGVVANREQAYDVFDRLRIQASEVANRLSNIVGR